MNTSKRIPVAKTINNFKHMSGKNRQTWDRMPEIRLSNNSVGAINPFSTTRDFTVKKSRYKNGSQIMKKTQYVGF